MCSPDVECVQLRKVLKVTHEVVGRRQVLCAVVGEQQALPAHGAAVDEAVPVVPQFELCGAPRLVQLVARVALAQRHVHPLSVPRNREVRQDGGGKWHKTAEKQRVGVGVTLLMEMSCLWRGYFLKKAPALPSRSRMT